MTDARAILDAAFYDHAGITLWQGDCRDVLSQMPAQSVQTCVTSPPYFGLRDYGTAQWEGGDAACDHAVRPSSTVAKQVSTSTLVGSKDTVGHQQEGYRGFCRRCGARRIDQQIGLEPSPAEFVAAMVGVFREVKRVLRDDGTVWLNLGDSYNAGTSAKRKGSPDVIHGYWQAGGTMGDERVNVPDLAPKQLLGMPWRVAFALQDDGWWLRSDIIWAKPNPMPESVTDRPTRSHEYIFLLSKAARYFYDADAIAEPSAFVATTTERTRNVGGRTDGYTRIVGGATTPPAGRNKRDVWTIATAPYPNAHFATFPPKLIEPCILAGCPPGGVVLDPFAGAGTTLLVAKNHNRQAVGIELSPDYCRLIVDRLAQDVLPLEVTA